MKCHVCKVEVPREKNSIVCSEKCQNIWLKVGELDTKYFRCNGCDNCWGDLHGQCSETCRREFRESGAFIRDLWSLVRIFYPQPTKGEDNE